MVRAAFSLALVLLATASAALETPLTLTSNNRVVVIDPAFGNIALFETSNSNTVRQSVGKGSNFVHDLELRIKRPFAERNGIVYSLMRLGDVNNKPTAEETLSLLPKVPSELDKQAGKPALQAFARKAEDEFWKKEPAYDGVVRAALSQGGGRYLMLAIPSAHALLLYQIDGDKIDIVSYRNFGPELFINTGFNTTPDANAMLRELPEKERKEALGGLGMLPPEGKAPAAGADDNLLANVPPTPASDPWLIAGPSDSFLFVDTLTAKAVIYQWNGKALVLNAVRSLTLDLMVPGLIKNSYNSEPAEQRLLDAFVGTRKAYLQKYDFQVDRDNIIALVSQRQGGTKGKASSFEGTISNTGVAFLNFVERRTFLTIDLRGGQNLNLVSARDYTLDIGIGLLDQEIKDRIAGAEALGDVRRLVGARSPRTALLALKLALSLDPTLNKDAEKMKGDFKGELQTEFQALIDEAAKKADELKKQAEERKKMIEDKKKAK